MERNVIKLKVDNKDKDLATYLKPQWSWKTLITIGIFSFILVFIVNDLEIDFIKFNDVDVVRHSLVRKIARAYEKNLDTKRKL